MKIENIPAYIKSKSLKEARKEIDDILAKLESDNLNLMAKENEFKRLVMLNKHVENLFKEKSKQISNLEVSQLDDKK
tara:strand:+ start:271 stop:501 length:231 start_codon:yes stop_codon:yes gene_type:complete